MINNLRSFPKVLFQKLVFTILIGVGCFVAGAAFYLFSKDRITIMLSATVLLCSAVRAYLLYIALKKGKYETIEGTCVSISARPLRKHRVIKIMSNEGIENTLHLSRQTNIKIGVMYRFFFTARDDAPLLGSEYLSTALSNGQFLGLEQIEIANIDAE